MDRILKSLSFFILMSTVSSASLASASESTGNRFFDACTKFITAVGLPSRGARITPSTPNGYVKVAVEKAIGRDTFAKNDVSVGDFATVNFAKGAEEARTYSGEVISVYQAGLDLLASDGSIHKMNQNDGKILQAFVMPMNKTFSRVISQGVVDAAQASDHPVETVMLLSIHHQQKTIRLFGKVERIPEVAAIRVTDRAGAVHEIHVEEVDWIEGFATEDTSVLQSSFQNFPLEPAPVRFMPKIMSPQERERRESAAREVIGQFKQDGVVSAEEAEMLKPQWPYTPTERLSDEQFENLKRNLLLTGIDTFFGWKDRREWEVFFFQGISIRAHERPDLRDLAMVLLEKNETPNVFRRRLNAWSVRHKLGYQFAFVPDVRRLGEAYHHLSKAADSNSSSYVQPNGYVPADLYLHLFLGGVLPIGDEHDVFLHIASLADRQAMQGFVRSGTIILRALEGLGFPTYQQMKVFRESRTVRLRALAEIFEHMHGTVRDSTHENFSYLVSGADGRPALFCQGNGPMNFSYYATGRLQSKAPLTVLLNYQELEGPFAVDEPASLPEFEKFLESSAKAKDLHGAYVKQLERHGMSSATARAAYGKLRAVVGTDQPPRTDYEYLAAPTAKLFSIYKKLADAISNDTQLADMFSRQAKLDLIMAAVEFYSHYLEWIEKQFPNG